MLARIRHRLRFVHKWFADIVVWMAASLLAFLVRFEFDLPAEFLAPAGAYFAASLILKSTALIVFRFNLRSWRKVTFMDVPVLVAAVTSVVVVQLIFVAALRPSWVVPASVPFIDAAFGLLGLFGLRAVARWRDERIVVAGRDGVRNILVVGAGESGAMLVREMLRHPEMALHPIGFVDDDPEKRGMRIASVPVLGSREDLADLLKELDVDEVFLSAPSADGSFVRDALERVRRASRDMNKRIGTRVVPALFELINGDVTVQRLRDVRLEDLLRRQPVELDRASLRAAYSGRRVLVTGAGGSIGGEIVRQLAAFDPAELLLLGRGENSLVEIERELRRSHPELSFQTLLGSVRGRDRMATLFERYRPQVVVHAGAHKHVPLLEQHPEEAILNNVMSTQHLTELALQYGVERFVNVSTDKAVRPTSVMGASKRIAECLVKDAASRSHAPQSFASVRFGNVLGSRGSVVPLFRRQIADGGPVTITDKRMTRYFMTIPEAAQLVLQAGALASNGSTYILDMGKPVRIVDLAEDLIRLSGLEPGVDVKIHEVGMRPGEKLYEELLTDGERTGRKIFDKITVATAPDLVGPPLQALVKRLEIAARAGDRGAIVSDLHANIVGSQLLSDAGDRLTSTQA